MLYSVFDNHHHRHHNVVCISYLLVSGVLYNSYQINILAVFVLETCL